VATQAPRQRPDAGGRAAPEPTARLEGFVPAERPSVLDVVARRPFVIAAATVLTALLGFVLAKLEAPTWRASGKIFLVDPNRELGLELQRPSYVDPRRNARSRAEVVLSNDVFRTVARRAHLPLDEVKAHVDAVPDREADIIEVTASAGSAAEAARLVALTQQSYAEVYRRIEQAPFRRALADLDRMRSALIARRASASGGELTAIDAELSALADRSAQLRENMALLSTGLQDFEEPLPPEAPAAPRPLRSAAVGAMLGFLASIALLWFYAARRATATRADLAAPRLGAALLVDLPARHRPWQQRPEGELEDAYRRLAHGVRQRTGGRAILVTASRAEDLYGEIPERLAAASADTGGTPLLVDGDPMRRRRRTRNPGIWDVATGTAGRSAIGELPVGRTGETVPYLAAGTAAYQRAQAGDKAPDSARVQALFADYDPVIVAGPEIQSAVTSRLPPLPAETAVVVVVTSDTPLQSLWELRSRLEVLGLRLIGYVYEPESEPLWQRLVARLRR
jgi:hypothetical protein